MIQHDVMIVEGYRSLTEVMDDQQLSYDDKLRILEKWNQMLAMKSQVFPDQSDQFIAKRKEIIALVNTLAKKNMHLFDQEMSFD